MEFRRINSLPPYVFGIMDALKIEARRAGEDVVDLGFGNPDIPSPDVAVKKLAEAVENPRNHRYSSSKGLPKLRLAITDLYRRKFGVDLDPETQACSTIGAKEGFSHLMWVLLGPGDAAMVPSPSYPIHIWGPILAGAEVRHVRLGPEQDFFANLLEAWEDSLAAPARDRALVPAQPDHRVRRPRLHDAHRRVRPRARRARWSTTSRTPTSASTATTRRRSCRCPAPPMSRSSSTPSPSRSRWRAGASASCSATPKWSALGKLKSYLDYGTFQPIQIAATVAMNEAPEFPKEVNAIYQGRRDALIDGLARVGWDIEKPKGTMFVWAPIPTAYEELGSLEFAKMLVNEAKVAVSPGVGFGPGGEGFVRFALVENEHRIGQAVRGIRRALTKLG